MSYKIILADLDKYLFPEVYPFYKSHFDFEKELLAHKVPLDKLSIQNTSLKIKKKKEPITILKIKPIKEQ
ncbi:MAG: hypothetical protein JJU28_16030 [Cyclobacteriaceae bacterium]|nr:hypothetical protein [Cyclobacteriaceae bacterium]